VNAASVPPQPTRTWDSSVTRTALTTIVVTLLMNAACSSRMAGSRAPSSYGWAPTDMSTPTRRIPAAPVKPDGAKRPRSADRSAGVSSHEGLYATGPAGAPAHNGGEPHNYGWPTYLVSIERWLPSSVRGYRPSHRIFHGAPMVGGGKSVQTTRGPADVRDVMGVRGRRSRPTGMRTRIWPKHVLRAGGILPYTGWFRCLVRSGRAGGSGRAAGPSHRPSAPRTRQEITEMRNVPSPGKSGRRGTAGRRGD